MKILKFNAVWCPSCLVMKKVWKELKEEINDIEIIEYDYDIDEDEVSKYNVSEKLPVVIMVDEENNEIKRLTGEKTKEELINFIRG
jgi:thiol-disulfide isomerase/thioredoxin